MNTLKTSGESPLAHLMPELIYQIVLRLPFTPKGFINLMLINKYWLKVIIEHHRFFAAGIYRWWSGGDPQLFYRRALGTSVDFISPRLPVIIPYGPDSAEPELLNLWHRGAPQYFPAWTSVATVSLYDLSGIYYRCKFLNMLSAKTHIVVANGLGLMFPHWVPLVMKWNAAGLLLLYRMADLCRCKYLES